MKRLCSVLAGLALLSSLSSCGEVPRTQVMIEVDADTRAADRIFNVRYLVEPDFGEGGFDTTFVDPDFPFLLAIIPRFDDASREFAVTLQGMDEAGEVIVEAKLPMGFENERTKILRLDWDARCLDVACSNGWLCVSGVCESPETVLESIEDITGQ